MEKVASLTKQLQDHMAKYAEEMKMWSMTLGDLKNQV
jgi:hypothetical protein